MEALPSELLHLILKEVDEAYVLCWTRVCKQWLRIAVGLNNGILLTEELEKNTDPVGSFNKRYRRLIKRVCKAGQISVFQWAEGSLICNDKSVNLRICGWAASAGHIELLQYLRSQQRQGHRYYPWIFDDHQEYRNIHMKTALKGQLGVLKWAKENGLAWHFGSDTPDQAAYGGHLELLEWLRENGCPFGYLTCQRAAMGGHLEVIRWAESKGYPLSGHRVCLGAASTGQLAVLQWATSLGLLDEDEETRKRICSIAAWGENFEVVKWLHDEMKCPIGDTGSLLCFYACKQGNLEMLQWLIGKGCEWDDDSSSMIAETGRLDMLKWAIANGCPWKRSTCESAAQKGHISILQYARENDRPWGAACYHAALGRQFEVLQWAYANGCNLVEGVCYAACQVGHLEMLQWATGKDWHWNVDVQSCIEAAASRGHLHILKWIIESCATSRRLHGGKNVCKYIAATGRLDTLMYVRAKGFSWDEETCSRAASQGHLEIIQWARANGCPWDEETCNEAARGGFLDLLQWARAQGCPWSTKTCASAARYINCVCNPISEVMQMYTLI